MDEHFYKHFAEALNRWIKRERYTDTQAAKQLGITFHRLQLILSLNYKPTAQEVAHILSRV